MNSGRLLTILLVGILLSACAEFTPYRTETLNPKSGDLQPKVIECAVESNIETNDYRRCETPKSAGSGGQICDSGEEPKSAGCYAIQHRHYRSYVTEDENKVAGEAAGIGRITDLKGTVHIERDGKNIEVQDGDWVKQSDKLLTGADGKVTVTSSNGQLIKAMRKNRVLLIGQKGDGDKTKVITKESVSGNYYLSFVEFDDHGWFADRKQMEALFALLKKIEKEKKAKNENDHPLIYVYAHGWKHNASPCDNNVVCFSRLLERHDLAEKIYKQDTSRTVVGVYIGWRGLPFGSFLNNASFWTRKEAAARVGRGGVFELLTRLKDYRDSRVKKDDGGNHTQLVITGHSFGGLVIYEALSHALMEQAAKSKIVNGTTEYEVAGSFGDFVMLVNPAFEGSLYEPLFHIATNRCYRKLEQRPVMMIVTSEADDATRVLFPMGRSLSTLFQRANPNYPDQAQSILRTIGHDPRYQTHCLALNGKGPQEPPVVGGDRLRLRESRKTRGTLEKRQERVRLSEPQGHIGI